MCEVFVNKYGKWLMCSLRGSEHNHPDYPNPWPGHAVCSVHRKMNSAEILDRQEAATVYWISEFVRRANGVIHLDRQLYDVLDYWRNAHNKDNEERGIGPWDMPLAEALSRECDGGFSGHPLFLDERAFKETAKRIAALRPYGRPTE